MITALIALLIITNYLWYVAFTSYRNGVISELDKLLKEVK